MDTPPIPLPERKKRNVFIDLRKFLSDISIRATRGAFQSASFLEGITGWRLNANGLIEGTRLKLDNFVPYSDSSLVFNGTWEVAGSAVTLSPLSRKRSSTVGDSFTISFTGTSIGVVMEKAGNQGKVSFSLDGGEETIVDLYQDNGVSWRSVVYSAIDLRPGNHVLVGTVATKNVSALDNRVSLQGYVKSPTSGIKLSDISANLFLFTSEITTDANGYAESNLFTVPDSSSVVWSIVGVAFNEESVMSDATLTEPKLAWRGDESVYLYNGAPNTGYHVVRSILVSDS